MSLKGGQIAGVQSVGRWPNVSRQSTVQLAARFAGAEAWYGTFEGLSSGNNTGFAINTLFAQQYFANAADGLNGLLDRIALDLSALGAVGSVARLGIYNSGTKPFYPSTLLVDSGSFATDAGPLIKTVNISLRLRTGIHWLVYVCGVAAPTVRTWHPTIDPHYNYWGQNATLGAPGGSPQNLISVAFPFAALPGTFPAGAVLDTGFIPGVYVRYA